MMALTLTLMIPVRVAALLRWRRVPTDLSMDIVSLGFVKNLTISSGEGDSGGGAVVSFSVELTTPACPVKEVGYHRTERSVDCLPTRVNRSSVRASRECCCCFLAQTLSGTSVVRLLLCTSLDIRAAVGVMTLVVLSNIQGRCFERSLMVLCSLSFDRAFRTGVQDFLSRPGGSAAMGRSGGRYHDSPANAACV